MHLLTQVYDADFLVGGVFSTLEKAQEAALRDHVRMCGPTDPMKWVEQKLDDNNSVYFAETQEGMSMYRIVPATLDENLLAES